MGILSTSSFNHLDDSCIVNLKLDYLARPLRTKDRWSQHHKYELPLLYMLLKDGVLYDQLDILPHYVQSATWDSCMLGCK